ncbi:MAG: DapH/DapD/GlmU-related protein [Planctomycetota bacterium]
MIVAAYSELGRHVAVNRGATIGHHTMLGDYCSVQPMAGIAGNCRVGPRTYVGLGARIIDGINIGEGCVVGAGAVVTRDVPDRCLVLGMPAKVVKQGIEGI